MADQQHVDLLLQGVATWNAWMNEHIDMKPNLRKANLKASNLSGAYLIGADLSYANLKDANLDEAYLDRANLKRANLKEAELNNTHLRGANLSKACLVEANLNGADLVAANLCGANLSQTLLIGTYFNEANLNEANLSGACMLEANLYKADLCGAELAGASLNGANLQNADLTGACLVEATLDSTDLSGANLCLADLSEANLNNAILVGTCAMDANFTNCKVYGIAAWDIELEGAQQLNLIITPEDQPTITVDNLEVAQFIYFILKHKNLRNVLNSIIERGVLLLGRFNDGGIKLLEAVAAKLRESQYLPIIFDFDRPNDRNLTETIITLVGLSRFVIVDLSGPSVANELRSTIPNFRIPFVPIIEKGRETYSMFSDFFENEWVLSPVEFLNEEHLMNLLSSKVIEPAEKKVKERQALLKQLFNR